MQKKYPLVVLPLVLVAFALAFAFMAGAAPVQASSQAAGGFLQTTPMPTIAVDVDVTAVVPDTGAPRTTVFFSSWLVWLVLGLAVIVLLAALIARGRPTTEIHEHHDHYD